MVRMTWSAGLVFSHLTPLLRRHSTPASICRTCVGCRLSSHNRTLMFVVRSGKKAARGLPRETCVRPMFSYSLRRLHEEALCSSSSPFRKVHRPHSPQRQRGCMVLVAKRFLQILQRMRLQPKFTLDDLH